MFLLFKEQYGILVGTALLSILVIAVSLLGLWNMDETFGKDLNYLEEGTSRAGAGEVPETIIKTSAQGALHE